MNVTGRGLRVLLTAALCISFGSVAMGDDFEVVVFRQSGIYYYEMCAAVTGGVSVELRRDGDSNWIAFDEYGPGEFDVESSDYSSLAGFNSGVAGGYTLQVMHGGGTSEYTFTINEIQDSWFPAYPVLAAVPGQIPQQYEFSWTWDGTADVKEVEYGGFNGTQWIDEEAFFDSGDSGFDDKSLMADFGSYTGSGEFLVLYGTEVDSLISDWLHVSGADILGATVFQGLASEAEIEFTVVPEPTTAAMVALGALAMIRRRRRS